jgi:hypothetical protein
MKKDAFYFPHFSNASRDKKINRLEKELGIEGYGIFFKLLEVLREESEFKYPMQDIDLLADQFRTSEQKIRVVICNYGLFDIDDNNNFFSPKFILYLSPYLEQKQLKKINGLKGNLIRHHGYTKEDLALKTPEEIIELNQMVKDGVASESLSGRNKSKQSKQIKQRKVNKEKNMGENIKNLNSKAKPKNIEEVKEYCQEKGSNINPETFFNFYEAKGWVIGKSPVKDWKACLRTWETKNKQNSGGTDPYANLPRY